MPFRLNTKSPPGVLVQQCWSEPDTGDFLSRRTMAPAFCVQPMPTGPGCALRAMPLPSIVPLS